MPHLKISIIYISYLSLRPQLSNPQNNRRRNKATLIAKLLKRVNKNVKKHFYSIQTLTTRLEENREEEGKENETKVGYIGGITAVSSTMTPEQIIRLQWGNNLTWRYVKEDKKRAFWRYVI